MICAMMGATLAAVDVFLAYISVVIFFLSVSLLLFCYWRYSGRVRRALMPRDGRRDGRTDGRTYESDSFSDWSECNFKLGGTQM